MATLPVKNRTRSIVAACVLGALVVSAPGCYGRFPTTNSVYRWNGRVTNNGFANSVVMVVLVIIPVYPLLMIVDGLILNSIEYWDGRPIQVSKSVTLPDGAVATLSPGATPDVAILTIDRNGHTEVMRTYARIDETHTNILDENGAILSVVERRPDGSLLVRNDAGDVIAELRRDQIEELAMNAK